MLKLIYKYKDFLGFCGIIAISVYALSPLLNTGFPITHDGIDHIVRIANFYQGILDGNFFPRWGANLNWGYGHPVMMFLYPLSSYTASFFLVLGFEYETAVKLVFAISYVLSGMTMFLWAKNQFNFYVGFASACLYLLAPYRFIDLYVRGALGEHIAFIFPPLILYFILKFFQKNNNLVIHYFYFTGIAISTLLLILGHNAITIMFMPLIITYTVLLGFENKNKTNFLYVLFAIFTGFALSSFFLIPAFFEGKYTLREVVTGDEYKTRFIEPISLLYGDWNFGITGQFSTQLGLFHIAGFLLLPLTILNFKKNKKVAKLLLIILAFFILSIFLTLQGSNFIYQIITTLKKFQFPWRFLSLSVFTISVLSASAFYLIKKDYYRKIALILFVFFILIYSRGFIQTKGYFTNQKSFYTGIYKGTTDTGESAPIWSIRFMEKSPTANIMVIEGTAEIRKLERNSVRHVYDMKISSQARLVENTLYFPGWEIYANGTKKEIEFQDPSHRGLMTFRLPEGEYKVEVVFKDTRLRALSSIISIVTAGGIILFSFWIIIKQYGKKTKK